MKGYYEVCEPIEILDYKSYHVRFYISGSAIDVNIYDENKENVLSLCDYKTMGEAKRSAKSYINEGDFD